MRRTGPFLRDIEELAINADGEQGANHDEMPQGRAHRSARFLDRGRFQGSDPGRRRGKSWQGGDDSSRGGGKSQRDRPGSRQPGRKPLVAGVPVQQLPADQRSVELQPQLPAGLAGEPDRLPQPHHASGDPGLRQRAVPDIDGRERANDEFRRLDPARAAVADEHRPLAARRRADVHFSDGRLGLHRARESSRSGRRWSSPT